MTDSHDMYRSPFSSRYASQEMRELFSDRFKFTTWRKLWLALAESQQELGLEISDEQLADLRAHQDDIDFELAGQYERKLRHDVMAHIHALGDVAAKARPIVHLGATSQYVNCNTDMIQIRAGLRLLLGRLVNVIDALATFAGEWKDQPTLGFTHFQPAQLTTVGKRAVLWANDFVKDLADLEYRLENLEFRGAKGTTGTQASYLALFDGDHEKVRALDRRVAEKMGFEKLGAVTGQTYSRKVDAQIAHLLAGIAVSAHKFCNDIRLLAHRKELEEPFGKAQVGSSAMAYKRNPMRCERATALSRFVIDLSQSPAHTAAEQWLERTLDDSANKRLSMSECFLATDEVLTIVLNVAQGLVVYPAVIEANVAAELPFMATENILMALVAAGGDRQELHEKIRVHSMDAAAEVKQHGRPNDLIARLQADPDFAAVDLNAVLDPRLYTGRAPQQVEEFTAGYVQPIREKYTNLLGQVGELKV